MKAYPTLRQLQFFVALISHCHFGKAAQACFVSQSTLSAAIQELEEVLGVTLLERSRRQVKATVMGLALAQQAKEILTKLDDFMALAQTATEPMSGPLHLGLIPTIAPYLLPHIMPRLHKDYPDLKIYLREEKSAELCKQLAEGQLDGAILALPYPISGMTSFTLAQDHFWLACRQDHPLAKASDVSLSELAHEDLLLLADGHCLRDHALAACGLEGAHRNQSFQGTSLHTIVQMVANGLGVTLLPDLAISGGILKEMNLKLVALADEAPARQIALIWRQQAGRHETMTKLGEIIRQQIKSLKFLHESD